MMMMMINEWNHDMMIMDDDKHEPSTFCQPCVSYYFHKALHVCFANHCYCTRKNERLENPENIPLSKEISEKHRPKAPNFVGSTS